MKGGLRPSGLLMTRSATSAPTQATATIDRDRACARGLEDAELHQQQRDHHVEHQPDDAAGMAVGQPGEEIRPRDRARIGVGDVDLELRDDDEGAGEGERDVRRGEYRLERDEIHLRRLGRLVDRNAMANARRKARNEPASSLSMPGTIQPGPAASSAVHQAAGRPASRGGRKRRKSTCSPICAISENTTVEAAPNSSEIERSPSAPAWPP